MGFALRRVSFNEVTRAPSVCSGLCRFFLCMSNAEHSLKDRVRAFWQANPCGTKFSDAEVGSRRFFERVEEHRYRTEWHIPDAAGFNQSKGLRVLEIGCGLGTDGAGFARGGAVYTGVDLTDAAVGLARRRFELEGLPGVFRVADATSSVRVDGVKLALQPEQPQR